MCSASSSIVPKMPENNWDVLNRKLPNFYGYNTSYSLKKTIVCAFVSAVLSELCRTVESDKTQLGSKGFFWLTVGFLAGKGIVAAAANMQTRIYLRSNAVALADENIKMWGGLCPPRDYRITGIVKGFDQAFAKFNLFFPTVSRVIYNQLGETQPKAYSQAQLEQECNDLMEKSLQIATSVRDDLKEWSATEKFSDVEGEKLKGRDLLIAQVDRGRYTCPWLFRGFFLLPRAYRTIFNLDECTQGLSSVKQYAENPSNKSSLSPEQHDLIQRFEQNYPDSNREILKEWKKLFFKPGTIQYRWKEQYNALMKEIFDLGGQLEGLEGMRFREWGAAHRDGDYSFSREPDGMPT